MFLLSVFIIFIIFIILIYTVIKYIDIRYKNLLVLSTSIIFIFAHILYFNSLGYSVSAKLPSKFNLLYVHKSNDYLYMMINNIEKNYGPRLFRYRYSIELEEILEDALNESSKGSSLIGIYSPSNTENSYGIKFKKVKRKLPSK